MMGISPTVDRHSAAAIIGELPVLPGFATLCKDLRISGVHQTTTFQ